MRRVRYGFEKKNRLPVPAVPVPAVPAARRGCTRPVPAVPSGKTLDTSPLRWTGTPFNEMGRIYIYYTVMVNLKICTEKNYKT
jgi:hypothetical protein